MTTSSLRSDDVRALLGALDLLYQPVEQADFPSHLFAVLTALFPDATLSFDFIEQVSGKVTTHIAHDTLAVAPIPEVEAVVREYLWQNPVVAHVRDGRQTAVVQPTDLVSQRQFRRTDFYHLVFRPIELEYQIFAGLTLPGHHGGLTINRGGPRNFTEREVELVQRLRPHVERAYTHALRLADLRRQVEAAKASAVPESGAEAARQLARRLTGREGEVLGWLAEGKRNDEIALILGISPRTVHKHVEHLFAKLGVETRTAAALLAHKM